MAGKTRTKKKRPAAARSNERPALRFARADCKPNRLVLLPDEVNKTSFRSPFARDRDRIAFSKAFRRLAKKTQVYLAGPGSEHLRTRLTHTLEVAQIAKDMAVSIGVSEAMTESISLGHDVGHPPFGHAGEQELSRILAGEQPLPSKIAHSMMAGVAGRDFGGFKHNFQSVRLLDFLEEYHPDYNGLDLNLECLEGILKHTKLKWASTDSHVCEYPDVEPSLWDRLIQGKTWCTTVEGQIVKAADAIAQVIHDLSDAVEIGVLPIEEVARNARVVRAIKAARKFGKKVDLDHLLQQEFSYIRNEAVSQLVSALFDYFVRRSIAAMRESLDKSQWVVSGELLPDGPEPSGAFKALEEFRDNLVINNYQVNRMDNKGRYLIRQLVDAYVSDPRQLPDTVLKRYLAVKRKELGELKGEFRDWLKRASKMYKLVRPLSAEEEDRVIDFVGGRPDGPAFRRLSSSLLEKVTVYMALDGDYMRSLVDYIAGMTDEFAEEEVNRLFH